MHRDTGQLRICRLARVLAAVLGAHGRDEERGRRPGRAVAGREHGDATTLGRVVNRLKRE